MLFPVARTLAVVSVLSQGYALAAMLREPTPATVAGECTDPGATVVYYDERCVFTPPEGMNEALRDAADEFGIDPWMLATTVNRESGCNPKALGTVGEIGLGQIHPDVWVDTLKAEGIIKSKSDLWKVRTNLRATAFVLKSVKASSLHTTFRRYNGSGEAAEQYADDQVATYIRTATCN